MFVGCLLQTGKMSEYMDSLEMFSCIVACLCHDLDHRGTNNAFQSKSVIPFINPPPCIVLLSGLVEWEQFQRLILRND